ncbi:thiamine pyrophosphate-binding protein (plasmid) [Bosea vestrisii]|uniref:thiamine pyrophosphate-binding protein n=1 Tax=Bosea vestrisii TaxID=151416 RepID=UPI0024DFD9C7|nr:thiamine pyrophosphate-binding protein [Bosea vestrisii]WID99858.1 thiamine pyrophosphate-binding protein [Bosea vestrisii]
MELNMQRIDSGTTASNGVSTGRRPNTSPIGHVGFAVAEALYSLDAAICFGVSGSTNYYVCEALERLGVRYIAAGHECNAIAMADAFARHSGRLTLASVHAGPGLTNAITAIAEAAKARTPLLVLAGDVAVGDVLSNFHIDQDALVRSVGAVPERLGSAASAVEDVVRSCEKAIRERRTVVLSMPQDILQSPAPPVAIRLLERQPPAEPDSGLVQEVAQRLVAAKRPLILAGRGAVIADAGQILGQLAAEVDALLATTARAHGLFANEPWSVGIMGGFSPPAMAELIRQSDTVVGFGATFTHWTTQAGRLIASDATVIQIDSDVSRLGCQRGVDIALLGDARVTAEKILRAAQELKRGGVKGWRNEMTATVLAAREGDLRSYADTSTTEFIDPRTLCIELDALLPPERTIANDGGHFQGWPPLYLTVPDAAAWSFAMSFSSTGLGLGTAIGAALAHPERLTVLCAGDGGFMMSLSDLQTAVNLKLRMCIVIFNDASYAAEVHEFGPLGYQTSIATFPVTDFAAIARGTGAAGTIVCMKADLADLRQWVEQGCNGVYLVDARINPDLTADWFSELLSQKHAP